MWREIKKDDIKVGTAVRLSFMKGTAFNGAVITARELVGETWMVTFARPMVYAESRWTNKQPMSYIEIFSISEGSILRTPGYEVFETKNGVESLVI